MADIGLTIDEPKNRAAAKLFVGWLELALQDIFEGNWRHFASQEVIESYFHPPYIYHPPFGRILTGMTWRLFYPYVGELEALRLAPALLFSLNVALLFLLISRFSNGPSDRSTDLQAHPGPGRVSLYSLFKNWKPETGNFHFSLFTFHFSIPPGLLSGMVAALALLLIPATFGHAHLIALDSLIASMWFLTVFCFVRGLEDSRWSIALGVVWGLALNTKIHAYFIPIPLLFWSFLYCRDRFQNNFFAMLFLSPIVLFLSNPYIWHDTAYNWFSFISIFVRRKDVFLIPTYFLGTHYTYSAPWYYPFFMAGITLPLPLLILSLLGALRSLFPGRGLRSSPPWQDRLGMLLLLNALAPLGLAALERAPTYDGVRLFLPAYPFLAGLAGVGFHALSEGTGKAWGGRFLRTRTLGLSLLFLLPALHSLAHIHPYELSYFNRLIGGARGAWESGLETTYWNDPCNPAFIRLLNQRFPGKTFRPDSANDKNFDYYHELGLLRKDITYDYDHYDYLLLAFRQGYFDAESWFYAKYIDPIHTVEVDGAPLLAIYRPLREMAPLAAGMGVGLQGSRKAQEQPLGPQEVLPPQLTVLTPDPDQPRRWSGLLKAPEQGWYELGVWTREGVEISLDHKKWVEAQASVIGSFAEGRVFLEDGFHLLEIQFRLPVRPTLFYLGWKTPSHRRGIIPAQYLASVKAQP